MLVSVAPPGEQMEIGHHGSMSHVPFSLAEAQALGSAGSAGIAHRDYLLSQYRAW